MHPGLAGVLVFLGTAGVIYAGGQLVGTYLAPQDGAEVAVTEQPLDLVPSTPEATEPGTQTSSGAQIDGDQADGDRADGDQMVAAAPQAAAPVGEAGAEEANAMARSTHDTPVQDAPVLDVVRVEPSGETVIAGSAGEGARVGLLYNDELIADTEADIGGDFVLVPDAPLPTGEGTMEVVILDEDGAIVAPSEDQVAVVVPQDRSSDGFLVSVLRSDEPVEIVERQAPDPEQAPEQAPNTLADAPEDTAPESAAPETDAATQEGAPAAPQVDIASRVEPAAPVATEVEGGADVSAVDAGVDAASPIVVIDAIELEGFDIWIAGAAEPGTIVRLYQDNALLGEALTGDEGRYLYEGTLGAATGTVTIRADALAPGTADVVARAEVPFDMPVVEVATAPPQPAETVPGDRAEQDAPAGAAPINDALADEAPMSDAPAVEAAEEAVEEAAPAAPSVTVASTLTPRPQTPDQPQDQATEPAADTPTLPSLETAVTAEPPADRPAEETATSTLADSGLAETADAAPAQEAGPQRIAVLDTGRVIIRRGDNLWRLSRRVYGQGIRYTSIYDANRDQIRNPALIFPGQVFELPTPQADWGEVPGFDALEPDQRPPQAQTSATGG